MIRATCENTAKQQDSALNDKAKMIRVTCENTAKQPDSALNIQLNDKSHL